MSDPAFGGVLLRMDGVVHSGDLAVQSFARHVASALSAEQSLAVLAGMRGFLEQKPDLLATGTELAGPELRTAEDGERAVEMLAVAAGLGASRIDAAREASRSDLSASAWVIDPPDGLTEIVDALAGRARVAVLTERHDPAAGPVLDACGLTDRVEQVLLPVSSAIRHLVPADGGSDRLLMIGTRWAGELHTAAAAGFDTAMVDRFGQQRGMPTWRVPQLAALVDIVRTWITAP